MSAPEKIVRNDTAKPIHFYLGNGDSQLVINPVINYASYTIPETHTQYTRSDLVEALVEKTDNYINANNALKSWRDDSNRNPSEYGKLNKAIQDAQHFCIEALKSLKALGE